MLHSHKRARGDRQFGQIHWTGGLQGTSPEVLSGTPVCAAHLCQILYEPPPCGCSTVGCSKPKSANSDEPFMGMTGSMGIRDSLDVKWP